MKKIYSFIMVSIIAMTANAQMVFNENFSGYTNGNLNGQGPVGNLWASAGSGSDVQVANTTPLIYSGYTSGTQYVTVSTGNNKSSSRAFTSDISTTTAKTIYMSFVIKATDAKKNNVDYNISLLDNSGTPVNALQFYAKDVTISGTDFLMFGISTNGSNVVYTGVNYSFATTYLVVIRYDIISGSNNDQAYLWVNPSLGSEPTTGSANISLTGGESYGAGAAFHALNITQTSLTPNAAYDAFRIAYGATSPIAWTNLSPAGAPLPVQLTSFNANEDGLNTKLIWNTVEESGIDSYVIERSNDGRTFTAIGSVKAANLKTYSFTDAQAASQNSFYRLKMIEQDGSFKYSYIISVKSKLSLDISLSPNPVKSSLMIQHPKAGVNGHIQIISAAGQTLKDIRLSANAVISNVDMSGFTSGLYHVVFRNGSDVFSKTVLKQ
ncbi:hypothetical protein A3860_16185 [Niastella vici]|uniref:Secretion system C-terminal sorting domain-containing protein n=1 Tax=Niastella vici TaxID=1703345 RepID=A0A1V9G3R2_9BACT|nr:T9SS type A sorting domain-containing protein [Niastella vici]OQP65210.1 hypothetical protein A3860_16185 [Niastella vici]